MENAFIFNLDLALDLTLDLALDLALDLEEVESLDKLDSDLGRSSLKLVFNDEGSTVVLELEALGSGGTGNEGVESEPGGGKEEGKEVGDI